MSFLINSHISASSSEHLAYLNSAFLYLYVYLFPSHSSQGNPQTIQVLAVNYTLFQLSHMCWRWNTIYTQQRLWYGKLSVSSSEFCFTAMPGWLPSNAQFTIFSQFILRQKVSSCFYSWSFRQLSRAGIALIFEEIYNSLHRCCEFIVRFNLILLANI